MDKKRNIRIIDRLVSHYPESTTDLKYRDNFQLLVAVMLSAQTTDRQVNRITEKLFKKYVKPEDYAGLTEEQLALEISGCGLYRVKAKNIIAASRILVERFGSRVPDSMAELIQLPGVGRKTANVVLVVGFGIPGMPVDTHVFRVSRRLGLADGKTPAAVEKALLLIVPPGMMSQVHHSLIRHGRAVCKARRPMCGNCCLSGDCPGIGVQVSAWNVGQRVII